MPLDKSGSKASVGNNITTEEGEGKPYRQALAIALNTRARGLKVKRKTIAKAGG